MIKKYDATRLPPSGGAISSSPIASEDTYLMNHLKASLESVWVHSNQNWEVLLKTLESEIGVQVIESHILVQLKCSHACWNIFDVLVKTIMQSESTI